MDIKTTTPDLNGMIEVTLTEDEKSEFSKTGFGSPESLLLSPTHHAVFMRDRATRQLKSFNELNVLKLELAGLKQHLPVIDKKEAPWTIRTVMKKLWMLWKGQENLTPKTSQSLS